MKIWSYLIYMVIYQIYAIQKIVKGSGRTISKQAASQRLRSNQYKSKTKFWRNISQGFRGLQCKAWWLYRITFLETSLSTHLFTWADRYWLHQN